MKEYLLKGFPLVVVVVLVCLLGLQLAMTTTTAAAASAAVLMSWKTVAKSELNLFTTNGGYHVRTSTLPPKFRPSKLVAKCGLVFYTSRQKICCGNRLFNRTGFKPSCCGPSQYDAMFDICCRENIIKKVSHPLNC